MSSKEALKIGQFITELREQAGLTQEELAEALSTSQSAVARMEKGEQNFSTEMLSKISRVLNREIITLSTGAINFKIEGGQKLSGTITTNTSKNSAVSLLSASLLNNGKTTLKGMPRIEEVFRIIEVLDSLGVNTKWDGNDLEINPPKEISLEKINSESANKTRSVLMLLGPLSHIFSKFTLPHAGGCHLGQRTVRPHLYALEKLGVKIKTTKTDYEVGVKKLKPAEIVLYESGDTVTENVLMAAAKIPGRTVIKFASANYQVQDLCYFLEKLGVKIDGIGTTTLTVHGVSDINQNVEFYPSEDPIESMLFLSIAATTNSTLVIERCPIDFLELELLKLEKMGFKFKLSKAYKSRNGHTNLVDIKTLPSKLVALEEKIYARPFPGLNIDNLPFFVPIATQAKGQTLIHDWVYENRAIYYMELVKLNADIILADPHRVFINGPSELKGAEVVCPPALRPAVIILIAMLAAKGTSILRNVYSINRGYEDLVNRLNKLGAKIKILKGI
ncbi:MAG: UDP-N-acetylglucosamine 1-carboxyvinyltransferase [Parcubacteria group bacterium Gr01-1014_20]|nr:MAG: UDP-N-acetylglucosamine 1-carboxyvinyltransferase [Parcubacteria group bacterium Gr01-1014_20]